MNYDPEEWAVLIYPPPSLITKPGRIPRFLPDHVAERAREYIATIYALHPEHDRLAYVTPMWLRFCEAWDSTGVPRKAMRVI